MPPVTASEGALADATARLAAAGGPLAVDAERASGFRYGQRAYLVQLRRPGAGTVLLDPVALPDLDPLAAVVNRAEWVLHAADQDLPCLRELGLTPPALFDTELASRLLGRAHVGLAAVVAENLGYALAKEHSAADWSTRPLPDPWLRYAALDVELLVELREVLTAQLEEAGKLRWAARGVRARAHGTSAGAAPGPLATHRGPAGGARPAGPRRRRGGDLRRRLRRRRCG
ncbi:ribonuclease D [Georgenia sp. SUBG003]|uniref:ribonuclease D n=1 Tax=Georgenia sp. SUBG003 TaxID=1497974 RepID=UPI003AB4FAAE